MAAPSCICKNKWDPSFFFFGSRFELDGSISIETCDPQTGKITGKHFNDAGVYDSDIDGVCQTTTPHIAFTREATINGVIHILSYSGDLVFVPIGGFWLVVRGRINRAPKAGPDVLVGDDGDWTAQTPVTLATKSRDESS